MIFSAVKMKAFPTILPLFLPSLFIPRFLFIPLRCSIFILHISFLTIIHHCASPCLVFFLVYPSLSLCCSCFRRTSQDAGFRIGYYLLDWAGSAEWAHDFWTDGITYVVCLCFERLKYIDRGEITVFYRWFRLFALTTPFLLTSWLLTSDFFEDRVDGKRSTPCFHQYYINELRRHAKQAHFSLIQSFSTAFRHLKGYLFQIKKKKKKVSV